MQSVRRSGILAENRTYQPHQSDTIPSFSLTPSTESSLETSYVEPPYKLLSNSVYTANVMPAIDLAHPAPPPFSNATKPPPPDPLHPPPFRPLPKSPPRLPRYKLRPPRPPPHLGKSAPVSLHPPPRQQRRSHQSGLQHPLPFLLQAQTPTRRRRQGDPDRDLLCRRDSGDGRSEEESD